MYWSIVPAITLFTIISAIQHSSTLLLYQRFRYFWSTKSNTRLLLEQKGITSRMETHRTQIACLSNIVFQVSGHQNDGKKALGLKNLHHLRICIVGYKSLVLVSTISTVLIILMVWLHLTISIYVTVIKCLSQGVWQRFQGAQLWSQNIWSAFLK